MPARGALLGALLAGLSAPALRAEGELLYGLNMRGKLTVNGTVLDSLPTRFDEDTFASSEQRYGDLLVVGKDRYALRRDGFILKNGKKLLELPFDVTTRAEWVNFALSGAVVRALREDGLLAADATLVTVLPPKAGNVTFVFTQIIVHGTDTYSLRWDGAVFKNSTATPLLQLTAGVGFSGFADGLAEDTLWVRIAVNPADGKLYALRRDGTVFIASLTPANPIEAKGSLVTKLPFPVAPPVTAGDFYADFAINGANVWHALRSNGQVFSAASTITPLVDYPGDGTNSNVAFAELAFSGADFWSVRGDGRFYKSASTTELLDLPQQLVTRLAVSDVAPDLSSFKNRPPVVATYNTLIVEGTSIVLPVILTDTDRDASEVVVTPIEPLPPGSSWDAVARELTWDPAGPAGKYLFQVLVNDGTNKPKAQKYPIKVLPPDVDPLKNKPPLVSKVKKIQALVGFEVVVPVIVDDLDGDELTVTADASAYPFTAGAEFDGGTRVFRWTPGFADIGNAKVKLLVSDGITTKSLTLSISVLSPLIFPAL